MILSSGIQNQTPLSSSCSMSFPKIYLLCTIAADLCLNHWNDIICLYRRFVDDTHRNERRLATRWVVYPIIYT